MSAPEARTPSGNSAGADNTAADAAIFVDLGADRKAFRTLQAQFARAGFELLELSDGSLLAHRWNLTKPLPDAHAARQFLKLIGGAA